MKKQKLPTTPLSSPGRAHIREQSSQDSTGGGFQAARRETQSQHRVSQPAHWLPSNGTFPVAISQRTIPKLKEGQETEQAYMFSSSQTPLSISRKLGEFSNYHPIPLNRVEFPQSSEVGFDMGLPILSSELVICTRT